MDRKQYNHEYHKIWYQKNKDKKLKQNTEYSRNHRKETVQYVLKSREKYKEKFLEYQKRFNKTLEGRYRLLKYRHQKRWNYPMMTLKEYKEIILNNCDYCGGENGTKGVDRIDNSIGYTKENSKSCCKICNYMKNNYSIKEFLSHIQKIYEFNKKI